MQARHLAPLAKATQHGFTLIEVLVALLLMALLSLMSWRALDSVVTTSERLDARAQDLNAIVRVLGQLQTDLDWHAHRDVLPALARDAVLPPGISLITQDRSAPLLALVREVSGGLWQQVFWALDEQGLRRSVGAPSATFPLPQPDIAGEVVLPRVTRFALRAWLPKQGWMPLPTDATGVSATGLEVTITRQQGDQTVPYRKVVLLP